MLLIYGELNVKLTCQCYMGIIGGLWLCYAQSYIELKN